MIKIKYVVNLSLQFMPNRSKAMIITEYEKDSGDSVTLTNVK